MRDVEVINFDGLSEAEALRIAGVKSEGGGLLSGPASAVATPKPFTDREAAEWMLRNGSPGCSVKIRMSGDHREVQVKTLAELPVESFVVIELLTGNFTDHTSDIRDRITDAEVLRLSGLKSLKVVELVGDVSAPSLVKLAHHPGLESLFFNAENLQNENLRHFGGSPLKRLRLYRLPSAHPAVLSGLAMMPNLRELQFVEIPNSSLVSGLPGLPQLTSFRATRCDSLTDIDLPLLVERFPNLLLLDLDSCSNLKGTSLEILAKMVTLRTLGLSQSQVDNVTLANLSNHPTLERLILNQTRISEVSLPVLKSVPSLKELEIAHMEFTDAGLGELASLPTLKLLLVKKDIVGWKPATTFTDTGIAAFEKLRPDVKVVK